MVKSTRKPLEKVLAVVAIAMALAFASIATLGMSADRAYAGGGGFPISVIDGKTIGLSYDAKSDWWSSYAFNAGKKVTAAKSSNTKVLEASQDGTWLSLKAKKAGKAKLTYKAGGKKHSATIIVKKYANPFKSYKVGKEDCAKAFSKSCDGTTTSIAGNGIASKVEVDPAKNWKIKQINAYIPGKDFKKVKNGAKLPSGTTTVQVIMTNAKTKVWQRTYLYMA